MKASSILLALSLAPSLLLAQTNVVGPNGVRQAGQTGDWWRDQQGGAFVDVTTTNGRVGLGTANSPYGSGSLEMSVTGHRDLATGYYPDWGFYYRYADTPGGFGNLSNLSSLSFDWWRSSQQGQSWNPAAPPTVDQDGNTIPGVVDWAYKTPAVRLIIEHDKLGGGRVRSELIWEGYYNQSQIGGPTVANQWNSTTGMEAGNFWFATPPTQAGQALFVTDSRCTTNPFTFWQGEPSSSAISQLTSSGGCLFGLNATVVGLGVGVGSAWPLAWHGFVDNVRMAFTTDPNQGAQCAQFGEGCAVNANFDFVPTSTVPEPSTWALMGAGLLGLGLAARRRRKGGA